MKTILHFLLLILVLAAGKISYAQLSSGLVAHYPFGGDASDISGYANNGIISGSVTLTADRFGTPDCAYEFTGDTMSYIRIPYDTSLSYTSGNPLSISLWYKGGTPDFGDFECLFGQWYGPGSYVSAYLLHLSLYDVNRANFCERMWEDLATTDTTGANWHHVVGIYDDGIYQLYKDNVLVGIDTSAPLMASTSHFVIGRTFAGKIDDIRVYNRAITAAEIDSIYNLPGSCGVLDVAEPAQASYAVYPNPTTGLVHVAAGGNTGGDLDMAVYDITGRQVLRRSMAGTATGSVDLSKQPDGIYVLKLRNSSTGKSIMIRKGR